MKLKLDENLDVRLGSIFRRAGHEVVPVHDQGLAGVDDQGLLAHRSSEAHDLETLDLDFASVLGYPPEGSGGSVVFRGPDDLVPTLRVLPEPWLGRSTVPAPQANSGS